MAFKLTKAQDKERDALAAELREKGFAVEAAIQALNAALEPVAEALQEALDAYNQAVVNALEFKEGIVQDARDQFNEKSESWQEGKKGRAAEEWIDAWENAEIEEIDFEVPQPIEDEFDPSGCAGALEDLPEKPESDSE